MNGFNVKLRLFENGQISVVYYPDCVSAYIEGESAYVKDCRSRNDFPTRNVAPWVVTDYSPLIAERNIYNPFSGEVETMTVIDDLKELQKREQENAYRSYRRTKNSIYDYSKQAMWKYFITLTFDGAKVDRYDFSECMKKARKWFNNQRNRKAPDLKYLVVPEQHKDGAWHIHGLLADTGDMTFTDSGHKTKGGETVYNLTGWRYGFSTATKVKDTYKCSGYICKYITKDLCEVTKGKHRYFVSNNINEVKEELFLVDTEDVDAFIEELTDSLGANLTYEKTVDGYKKVIYKNYIIENGENEHEESKVL